MAARLTGFVHVTHPETGDTEAFGPDDTVPGWAKGLITNPAAWTEAPPAESTAKVDEEPKGNAEDEPKDPPGDDGEAEEPKGNGSRDAWAKWADSLGVTYAEDATRDDIKAAVTAAQAQA